MERPDNVGNRKQQPNSNGNQEVQSGSTGNQRKPSDTSWIAKDRYGRDAAILRFKTFQDLLKEEETTMEDNWKGINEALTPTCQNVLGLNKHHHKEWNSIETLDKIKERKN
ncbi:unnamed protein product, partial [Schistosoma curassoni]|uniref:Reverse transcriptase domain-containing protein n=1 Tax=Schistosoma curassoni TaxID=6186 RepID=A0A183JVV6_9TREM